MSHIPTSPYHKEQHLEMLAHLKIHQKLSFYHILVSDLVPIPVETQNIEKRRRWPLVAIIKGF